MREGGRLQACRGVARQRIVRHDIGADQGGERDQREQGKGQPVTGFSAITYLA